MSQLFYGVYISPETELQDKELVSVFTNKDDALALAKKYKARFKSFSTYYNALLFSTNGGGFVEPSDASFSSSAERPVPFRSLRPQEYVALRKAIERGDLQCVQQNVESNPRYLVSSGDTPAILQEGRRFNAVHACADRGRVEICRYILECVSDEAFLKSLYVEDDQIVRARRIEFLLDGYLNTPCKAANETPLHYAAKNGHVEVVKLLVSYPACIRDRRNKYGDRPVDVVCSRAKDQSPSAVICALLNTPYFVPLLRTEDMNATIAEPCSPEDIFSSPKHVMQADKEKASPVDQSPDVSAYIGPVTEEKAKEIHDKWKVARSQARRRSSRNLDPEKGLETIGRVLATKLNAPWQEYWPFLNCYTDLRSEEGLALLEEYLHKKFMETEQNSRNDLSSLVDNLYSKLSTASNSSTSSETSPLDRLCQQFRQLKLVPNATTFPKDVRVLPPSLARDVNNGFVSGYDPTEFLAKSVATDLTLNGANSPKSLDRTFRYAAQRIAESAVTAIQLQKAHAAVAASVATAISDGDPETVAETLRRYAENAEDSSDEEDERNEEYRYRHVGGIAPRRRDERFGDHAKCLATAVARRLTTSASPQQCACRLHGAASLEPKRLFDDDRERDEDEESFCTALETDEEDDDSGLQTPDEGVPIFIYGCVPCKVDRDILEALDGRELNPSTYPNVCRWRHDVLMFSQAERFKWTTPKTIRTPARVYEAPSPPQTPSLPTTPLSSRPQSFFSANRRQF